MAKSDHTGPDVVVTSRVRAAWTKQRVKVLGLSTREVGKRAGISHGAVTHIEVGQTTTIRLSIYAGMLHALYGVSLAQATATTEEIYELQQKRYRDLAKAVSVLDDRQLDLLISIARSKAITR